MAAQLIGNRESGETRSNDDGVASLHSAEVGERVGPLLALWLELPCCGALSLGDVVIWQGDQRREVQAVEDQPDQADHESAYGWWPGEPGQERRPDLVHCPPEQQVTSRAEYIANDQGNRKCNRQCSEIDYGFHFDLLSRSIMDFANVS